MKRFLFALLILGLPALIYFWYIGFARNSYVPVPIFGPKTALGTKSGWGKKPDTLYHQIAMPIGTKLDTNFFNGKMTVLSTIDFSNEHGAEKQRLAHLGKIRKIFSENNRIQFWLICVTKDGKEPFELSNFVDSLFPVKPMKVFYTSLDGGSFFEWSQNQLLLGKDVVFDDLTGLPRTFKAMIIDNKRRIRGYYDLPIKRSADDVNGDLRALMVEIAGRELSKKPNQ